MCLGLAYLLVLDPSWTQGNVEALALYAGQSVGLVNNLEASSEIVARLVDEVAVTYKHLKEFLRQ